MPTKKIGIAYVPVLLSFRYQTDTEDDAQMKIKDLVFSLVEEWEGTEYEFDSMIAELNSLDWLRGSYMDQVQEMDIDDAISESEVTEDSSGSSSGEV